jgi:hypothetical protein
VENNDMKPRQKWKATHRARYLGKEFKVMVVDGVAWTRAQWNALKKWELNPSGVHQSEVGILKS